MELELALIEAEHELRRAVAIHGSFHSSHEGFAVLHEEFDELWDEVKRNPTKHLDRPSKMRAEAIQVAAMALRFLVDCCEDEP